MSDDYPRLVRRLAELATRIEHARAEAQRWYDGRCAAAADALAEAEAAERAARAELAALRAEVDEIDRDAAELWAATVERLGPAAARHGGPPPPSIDPAAAGADPERWLAGARDLLDRARDVPPLPRAAYPALAVFGVLGAAVAAALATAAREIGARQGGDLGVGLPVLALVVMLLGPFAGLAPAKALADRRHAALDPRAAAVVVVAGVVATALGLALAR